MAARLRACLLQHERQVLRLEGVLKPGQDDRACGRKSGFSSENEHLRQSPELRGGSTAQNGTLMFADTLGN